MASSRLAVVKRHLEGSGNVALNQTATPSFIYTLDNPRLSWEQRKFYEDNGFLVIPRLVGDALLDECRLRFVDLCEGRIDKGPMTLMKDLSLAKSNAKGEFLYYKVQDLVHDSVLRKYVVMEELLDYAECFTGPNIKAVNSMLINKPPDAGEMTAKHPLHQDLHYFPFRPADRIVASWTAMEKVTVDNGCLVVIPGSHRGQLHPHDYPKLENGVHKTYYSVRGYEDHPLLNLEMDRGDTVFFHPLLIHGSGVNRTKGFRKALSCHYAATDCYYIDVEGTSQENIAKEAEEMIRKKGIEDMDYKTYLQYRCYLARGRDITL